MIIRDLDPSVELLRTLLNMELSGMDNYVVSVEDALKAGKKKMERDLKKHIREELQAHPNDDDYKKELLEGLYLESSTYDLTYVSILQRTSFISLYSLLEFSLKRICDFAMKRTRTPLSFRDMKADGYINQNKKYLEKVIGLNLESLNQFWSEIMKYRTVRNHIVHEHSNIITIPDVPIESQPNYKLITSMESIHIYPDGTIIIEDFNFFLKFSYMVEQYLTGILVELGRVPERNIG